MIQTTYTSICQFGRTKPKSSIFSIRGVGLPAVFAARAVEFPVVGADESDGRPHHIRQRGRAA